jgi:hypothetical protein
LLGGTEADSDPCVDLFFDREGTVRLLSADLFEDNTTMTGGAPGAAYPLNGEGGSQLFDLKAGKVLGVEDIFKDSSAGAKLFFREQLARGALAEKRLEKLEGKKKLTEAEQAELEELKEDCTVMMDISHPYIRAQEKGLALSVSYPHARNVCNGEWSYLPFSKVKGLMKPESALYRYLADQEKAGQ